VTSPSLRPLNPRFYPRWGVGRWRHAVVIGEGGRSHGAHGLHGAAREILLEGPLAPVFTAAILAGAPEALALQLALLTLVNGVAIRQSIPWSAGRAIIPVSPRVTRPPIVWRSPWMLIPIGTLIAPIMLRREWFHAGR
jgi:hypothetical protein